mgnify:FL=1
MVYLKEFNLLSEDFENGILINERRNYFHNQYPFRIFPDKKLEKMDFANITILYGGNGSGKSTILNIIAEKLNAKGLNLTGGEMFQTYVDYCKYETSLEIPDEIKIIKSDDVFDYIYNVKRINNRGFNRREALLKEYFECKKTSIRDINDYQSIKNEVDAKRLGPSDFIRGRMLNKDVLEQSNGESALMYFISEIKDNGVYLLDEPENSMSASMQLKLTKFLEESARFFNCQFIIATHSPFILGMDGASIYDLDSVPVSTKNWWELENMKIYYNFFKDNHEKFDIK